MEGMNLNILEIFVETELYDENKVAVIVMTTVKLVIKNTHKFCICSKILLYF